MKLAVVIDVGSGPEALDQAVQTQGMLLDHMGVRLHSIRLAAPHLFQFACRQAIGDEPEMLAVAGGTRAARLAGQCAYESGVPVFFLPGWRSPAWAKRLWGSLSMKELIEAMARGDVNPTRLDAGVAHNQIFLESMECGLLAQIRQFRDATSSVKTVPQGWEAMTRFFRLVRLITGRALSLRCDGSESTVTSLRVTIGDAGDAARKMAAMQTRDPLHCTAWKTHEVLPYLGAFLRATVDTDWRRGRYAEHFDCADLRVDAGAASWFLLDGDPIRYRGPVDIHLFPGAIKTFSFGQARNETSARNDVNDGRLPYHLRPMGLRLETADVG